VGACFERIGDPRQQSGIGEEVLSQAALRVRHG
jgi:hypothetical protein